MSTQHEYRTTAQDILDAAGVEYVFGHGGKHPFVRIEHEGQMAKISYPSSSSDHRGLMNFRTELRKKLASMNVVPVTPVTETVSVEEIELPKAPPASTFPRMPGEKAADYQKRRYRDDPAFREWSCAYSKAYNSMKRTKANTLPEIADTGALMKAEPTRRKSNFPMLPGESTSDYRRRRAKVDPEYAERQREYTRRSQAKAKGLDVPPLTASTTPIAEESVAPIPETKIVEVPIKTPEDNFLADARKRFTARLDMIEKCKIASAALAEVWTLMSAETAPDKVAIGLLETLSGLLDDRAEKLAA
ncbi:hypothetical protein [Novosphingobium sp. TCA1]|uniref:hypothetical protein n=1 Tax=Novosphingobium sp. TCA1 TaxID=2682474 RepID=UPI0013092746|nr:hypothetical protein [Novosphingobium sp. TCA1]GFE77709.1 hypothetical protein NTCA1_53580 [Novosphingobium sp. TCA1]